eukprot:229030-Pleurochrysis_carterae.AAC.1
MRVESTWSCVNQYVSRLCPRRAGALHVVLRSVCPRRSTGTATPTLRLSGASCKSTHHTTSCGAA